jgi:hypothetical protein
MPGVRVALGAHWGRLVFEDGVLLHVSEHDGSVAGFPAEWEGANPTIDIEDPATLGCIIALAREALGEPLAHVVPFPTHVSDPIFGGLVPALWWAISTTADSAARFFPNDDGPSWAMAGPAPEDAWLAALEAAGRR